MVLRAGWGAGVRWSGYLRNTEPGRTVESKEAWALGHGHSYARALATPRRWVEPVMREEGQGAGGRGAGEHGSMEAWKPGQLEVPSGLMEPCAMSHEP